MLNRRLKIGLNLPGKILVLTIAFALVAKILVLLPAIADYRRDWLMQRVIAAKIASLTLETSQELPPMLKEELLKTAGVYAVSLKRPNVRQYVLGMPENSTVAATYDLRTAGALELVIDSLKALASPKGRMIRVIGMPDMMPDSGVDIIIDETPLRAALWTFTWQVFWLATIFALVVALPIYFALYIILVRPMMRLTNSMIHYREAPEDTSRIIVPSKRRDEIGTAERELSTLQHQLSSFLREKTRLANIGLAVSKINHDLRNMLSSAQLVSDRLAFVEDPTVKQFAPRLMRALDRAITLCADTLKYGRSSEQPPYRTRFLILPLLNEVKENLGGEDLAEICFQFNIPMDLQLWADRDQIFRVMSNLLRNAQSALLTHRQHQLPQIEVTAWTTEHKVWIRVHDNGPGLPEKIKANLFKAFQSTSAENGTGLGLAISAELVDAHGGEICLEDTPQGTTFLIMLPEPQKNGRKSQKDAPLNERMLAQNEGNH